MLGRFRPLVLCVVAPGVLATGCAHAPPPPTAAPAPVAIGHPTPQLPPGQVVRLANGSILGVVTDAGEVVDEVGNELGRVTDDGTTLRSADGSMLAQVATTGVVVVSAVAEEPVPLAPGDRIGDDGDIVRRSGSHFLTFTSDGSFRSLGPAPVAGTTSAPPSRARGLALYLLILVHADEVAGNAGVSGD